MARTVYLLTSAGVEDDWDLDAMLTASSVYYDGHDARFAALKDLRQSMKELELPGIPMLLWSPVYGGEALRAYDQATATFYEVTPRTVQWHGVTL